MNNGSDEDLTLGSVAGQFNLIEYFSFGLLLFLSAIVGIYYGFIKGNQNTVSEYMLGSKQMSVFPIAMSLIASHISGITLLGIPAEIYEYGTQFMAVCVTPLIVFYVTNTFYLPVFHELQLCSLYEIAYIPVVIYIPALAFHQVTGVDVHSLTPIICTLCIFYTTIGGLKAVVWTDAIQSIFTVGSMIVVIILGIKDVGGIQRVFELNAVGQRLEILNLDSNPFSRVTLWTSIIGATFLWIVALTVHPGSTQRFVALPSVHAAKKSVLWFAIGVVIINTLCGLVGLLMYAKYSECDLLKSGKVKKSGEVLPYYVQEVASAFPGLTGLFISGLVSAALSTMSAGLNTVAGTIYEDFIEKRLSRDVSDFKASLIMKCIVVLIGGICVLLVYVVEKLGAIIQLSYALNGAPSGAIFAAFALGLFFPWTNTKGVICGMAGSMIITSYLITGSQMATINKEIFFVTKPLSVEGCPANQSFVSDTNYTKEVGTGVFATHDTNVIYALSFLYYTPLGSLIGIIIGLVVSVLTGGTDLNTLDPILITPVMRKYLPKSKGGKLIVKRKDGEHVIHQMELIPAVDKS